MISALQLLRNPKILDSQFNRYFDLEPWLREFGNVRTLTQGTKGREAGFPSADIEEKNDSFVLKVDIPGIQRKDIEIQLDDGVLYVSGSRQSDEEEKGEGFHRRERFRGSFRRSFQLPQGATEKDIRASLTDGVLEVTIAKPELTKPRKIELV